jgi:hypothetical protein
MMATSSSIRAALFCALLGVTAAGCGDDTPASLATVATTTSALADYVTRVNELCSELKPRVLEVYGGGGHPGPYPIKVFRSEQPQLTSLYQSFDAQADAVPTTAADRRAVEALAAYRQLSDAATATMAAAAATGKQDRFDAAYYEVHEMFDNNPALNELSAVGIGCNAR